jgi:hypothetical protein
VTRPVLNVDKPPHIPQRPMGSIPDVGRGRRSGARPPVRIGVAPRRRRPPIPEDLAREALRSCRLHGDDTDRRDRPERLRHLSGRSLAPTRRGNKNPPGNSPTSGVQLRVRRRRWQGSGCGSRARACKLPHLLQGCRTGAVQGAWCAGRVTVSERGTPPPAMPSRGRRRRHVRPAGREIDAPAGP